MSNKISYVGVKAIICDGSKILITQEPLYFQGGGKWELPGGKLAVGEEYTPLEEILLREICEELGSELVVEVNEIVGIVRRPWNKQGYEADMVFLATYRCTYKSGNIALSEENNAYKWIQNNELHDYEFVDGYMPVLEKFFEQNNKTV